MPSATCSCFASSRFSRIVVINLVPAVIGVPLRTFSLATVLGITPSTLIYASIGDALGAVAEGEIALDSSVLTQPRFVLPLVGLAALALLPVLYRWFAATARNCRDESVCACNAGAGLGTAMAMNASASENGTGRPHRISDIAGSWSHLRQRSRAGSFRGGDSGPDQDHDVEHRARVRACAHCRDHPRAPSGRRVLAGGGLGKRADRPPRRARRPGGASRDARSVRHRVPRAPFSRGGTPVRPAAA